MDRTYAYLGGDELHSGMYVALIRRLEREGLTVDLVARVRVSLNPLATWKAWTERHTVGPNPVAAIRRQIRGAVHLVPIWSPLPGLSAPLLARRLRRPGGPATRIVVHTRQIAMGRLALALRRRDPEVRVICELEADTMSELRLNQLDTPRPSALTRLRWALEERFYARQERRLVAESDAVVCVSYKLKEVLIDRYRLTPEQAARFSVFPSVGDPALFRFDPAERERLRRDLGLQDRFVVVYSGNLKGRWQVPDKLVETFLLIREGIANAFFLILTPERDRPRIEPLLEGAGLEAGHFAIHSCPHGEVVRYLCAGDVGLLLRDRHPANEVAAPGKFAEYMLSGLPTVMTEGIGDFSEQVRDQPFACVLPGLDDLEASKARIQAFCRRPVPFEERVAQGRWAAERFSTELRIPQLAALYRSL